MRAFLHFIVYLVERKLHLTYDLITSQRDKQNISPKR